MTPLTETEASIVEQLADGMTAVEIAAARGTSRYTVKTQIERARTKAGAHTSAHLVAVYLRGDVAVSD